MNVMVFDVPAESGGALSILHEFYSEVVQHQEKRVNWIFVVGRAEIEPRENIQVLRFPWAKKSWWHRLYFDLFIAPRLVKKYRAQKVFSLQNTVVPFAGIEQVLYVHQSLPFVEHKFPFRVNRKFWLYQNVIGRLILYSIRKAKTVIVQTDWLRDICASKAGVSATKIKVIPPNVEVEIRSKFSSTPEALSTFFYPASALTYKNHSLIVQATQKLIEQGFTDFRVIFTLNGEESVESKELLSIVQDKQLPIEFRGPLSRETVFDLYGRSVLLFPSFIETFGLPMLEARLHETIVIASNCPFSREVLSEYRNAYFFDPFDSRQLAEHMMDLLTGMIGYNEVGSERTTLKKATKKISNVVLLD